MMRLPEWLWPSNSADGMGQSLLEDLRYVWRFQACRKRAVSWRPPDAAERAQYETHPLFGRFGDHTIAVAEIEGRRWVVRERDWHGWPDPPRYVFFAIEPDGRIWVGYDFNSWPGLTWTAGHQ